MRAIVTAQDRAKFSEATIYTVTYVGSRDNDSDVRWSYVQGLVRRGVIEPTIIARDRDGSAERLITVRVRWVTGYSTYGAVRGCCGHAHKTKDEAERCASRDRDGCAEQGGYSDRALAEIHEDGILYRLESDEYVRGQDGTAVFVG